MKALIVTQNFLEVIGSKILNFSQTLGRVLLFIFEIIKAFAQRNVELSNIYQQFIILGFYSLPIVGFTAIFSGAVLALQSYVGFARFSAESSIPNVVVLSITRELGPVLAALMVAGRSGSSIAAEIGTMKVTEQLDALQTLGTDAIRYLVAPRVLAGIVMLPILVALADIIGIFGGYLISIHKLDFSSVGYLNSTIKYLEFIDVFSGLVKAFAFGAIITITSCFVGYNCGNGAKGVGQAVTSAVVYSSILILLSNYLLTELFFIK
ncbi:MAG: ABC transporter permease [Rickettsiaceae bacterium]|nr:ABC transporter permease [Rickettsiaceae bacterium]